MKELLADHKKYAHIDLTDEQLNKLTGEPFPGAKIKVEWTNKEEIDFAYLFCLPGINDSDSCRDGDIFYHCANPDNSEGIGNAPEEFGHLNMLLENERCKKITVIGNEHDFFTK